MDERQGDWVQYALIVGLLAAMAVLVFAPGARSHSWYDPECCHQLDCAPVTDISFIQPIEASGMPQMVVTTKVGTAIIPRQFKPRESKDGQMHACMKVGDPNPATRFLCLYLPPGN